MSDLTDLAALASIKAASKHTPPDERALWTQIRHEINAYCYPDDETSDAPPLFDQPTRKAPPP